MQSVKVDRKELLLIVRENKEKHIEAHKLAREGWHSECLNILQSTQSKMSKDPSFVPNPMLLSAVPTSHEEDYDRAIVMLDMSVDDSIELPSAVFDQFVMDRWQWKHTFDAASSKYAVGGMIR